MGMDRLQSQLKEIIPRLLKAIIAGLAVMSMSIGGLHLGLSALNQTPVPSPTVPPVTPKPTETQKRSRPAATKMPTPTPDPTITLTPTAKPICGAPPSMTILVSGVTSRKYLSGLADAIRFVRVDFQDPNISVLALPRDLWVHIPALEDYGITHGKLNQAYYYGTEGMGFYDEPGYGSSLLASTLHQNYGVQVDHYVVVNLNAFRGVIDAIGGIDVYLVRDVYYDYFGKPKLYLKAGQHHLDGEKAEMLARSRITIGDYGRIHHQTMIIKAVVRKLLTPTGLKAVPEIYRQFIGNIQTDLSPSQISSLVCLAGEINLEKDVRFGVIPYEYTESEIIYDEFRRIETSVLKGNVDKIRLLIADFQAGLWP